MAIRRIVTALLAASMLVGAVACSDDDGRAKKSDDGTTTTEQQRGGDEPQQVDDEERPTTSAVTNDEYGELIARSSAAIDAAEGDLCELANAGSGITLPQTPEQVKQAVEVYVKAYEAFADFIEPEDPATANALRTGMHGLQQAAEKANYALSVMDPSKPPAAVTTREFQDATRKLSERVEAECNAQQPPGSTDSPTDAPG